MPFKFSSRSLSRLDGLHPCLVKVMLQAIKLTEVDFTILQGLRSIEEQKELVAKGASTTLNSRHLTGHAVDVAPFINGKVSWHWPHYHDLASYIKKSAILCDVNLDWGGDWLTFPDGPHWQLDWVDYPKRCKIHTLEI